MKSMLCRAGKKHRNISKPNERKIDANNLLHLGFVQVISPRKGLHRGVFPPNHLASRLLTAKPKELTRMNI